MFFTYKYTQLNYMWMLNSVDFCIFIHINFSIKILAFPERITNIFKNFTLYPCSVSTTTDLIFSLSGEKWWTKMSCVAES